MSYAVVESLLEATLEGVTGLPTLNKENTRYVPKANTPWTRTTFLPATARSESLGVTGKKQISGLFQIDLFYPVDSGTTAANTMADTVIDAFKASVAPTEGDLRVYLQNAQRMTAQSFNNFYQLPVLVSWFAFVPK